MIYTHSSKKRFFVTRRGFSLLELMIALILMSMLLSSLFYLLSKTVTLNQAINEQQDNAFKQVIAQKKLEYVFDHLQTSNDYQSLFYLQEISHASKGQTSCLNFTYDNGIDPFSIFSNTVYGQMFLNEAHQLILRTWPLPATFKERCIPMREQILFQDVARADFAFYKWNDKEGHGAWIDFWEKEHKEWPHLIRLHIEFFTKDQKREGEKMVFSFLVPHAVHTIQYH